VLAGLFGNSLATGPDRRPSCAGGYVTSEAAELNSSTKPGAQARTGIGPTTRCKKASSACATAHPTPSQACNGEPLRLPPARGMATDGTPSRYTPRTPPGCLTPREAPRQQARQPAASTMDSLTGRAGIEPAPR